MDLKVTIMLK